MRFTKWLAFLLTLCLLSAMLPAALTEEIEIDYSGVESGELESSVDEVISLDGGLEDALISDEPTLDQSIEVPGTTDAPAAAYSYARLTGDAAMFADADADMQIARLAGNEVALVIGGIGGMTAIAVNSFGRVMEGYVDGALLAAMSDGEIAEYQSRIAGGGDVALYQDDLNWPLGPLSDSSDTAFLVSNAANYEDLSNNTQFTINGVTVKASDVETQGSGNCWKWANKIYKIIWGTTFDSTFAGKSGKDFNLLRNLSDEERLLTPDNLKLFVRNAKPGATLRVSSCVSTCSKFDTDGLSCGHTGHSLIIAEIRSDGLVTMDDQGNVHTRFYTWQGFCNSWAKKYTHVKYIKWPNASAMPSMETVDGIAVTGCSEVYKVRATAEKGAPVCSQPSSGSVIAALTYPATFAAARMAVKTYEDYTWVYGKSSTGVTGWLPLTDAVVSSTEKIAVTGVALDQSAMVLMKGGTATLKVAIAPIDATNTEVSWSSSDTGVATVSGGTVTGVGEGTATITVVTADGSKQASCSVKVVDADASKTLSKTGSNGTVKMAVGNKLQLVPEFATAKGWKIKSVSSSNKKVATVSKAGIVAAKKAGTATITVKTSNGKKATLKVKVSKASVQSPEATTTPTSETDPKKIYLSKTGTVKLKKGKTLQLYTKLEPSTATTTLTWKSSNDKIAYVDGNGKVYALKKGTCTIGVKTANGVYATVKIKVV